ncbi:MAG: glutamate racemase [Gammaproteobacteria bacterium]|nr:glutamate racemase [Gammaproteobacteria bacterium]NND38774.1 glutamate racemase [Pseudomonadales bacterium]MBT8150660.1 glutamate racemase [Gammaproteobacteria bacterium]NNL11688.1 glutamate racemase [Pseudomonadales bacterium]NNM12372.1 glutamate racemase [Pseudomonadales bacterium]
MPSVATERNTSTRRARVLVFDSGLGGLSICKEIIAADSAIDISYLSDNAAFPYGTKQAPDLLRRASAIVLAAQQQLQPDLLVIACNTASTLVLPTLREQLDIPVVGVVPAIKTAAAQTKSGCIGLLATPGTVARTYTQDLIRQFAANINVISVGSSALVEMIEAHIYGATLDQLQLGRILEQFEAQPGGQDIDMLVLGCTHFPLIAEQISTLRPAWQLLDSGAAIASRVLALLDRESATGTGHTLAQPGHAGLRHHAYFSKPLEQSARLNEFLDKLGFCAAQEFTGA